MVKNKGRKKYGGKKREGVHAKSRKRGG